MPKACTLGFQDPAVLELSIIAGGQPVKMGLGSRVLCPSQNPLQPGGLLGYTAGMERTVHKARGFRAAEEWDIAQQIRMTPRERWSVARRLKDRVYGRTAKDVRACHRTN
jgi:hypothetical protein